MDIYKLMEQERIPRLNLPDIDMKDTISFQDSLSSGVNKLPIPQLYYHNFGKNSIDWKMVHNYTQTTGTPVLAESIKIYEKINMQQNIDGKPSIFDYICITAGATAAIVFFFRYFALQYPTQKVLLLGLNYYLFYECMIRNKITYYELCSKEVGRIAPTIDEIIDEIERNSYKLVVLTMPFNPSGEIYSEIEMRKLIRILKRKRISLLYDKCQMEEFANIFTYVNVNAIAFEENYLDSIILINSFSKTRSLAGIRIGYVCATKKIIDFINHENEYYYFNHPQVYIAPLVIDQLCKTIHTVLREKYEINIKRIVKTYRNVIVLTSGYDYYDTNFKTLFQEDSITTVYEKLHYDIEKNYHVIWDNYNYVKKVLCDWLVDITNLQGGFNFCIKLKNTSSREQLEFCSLLSKHVKAIILPESFYNGAQINPSDEPFWIRITCAYKSQKFYNYIDKIREYLQLRGETNHG